MGLVGFLNFALIKCFDHLAWPLLALGYPVYASILAIETNSIYHMHKLLAYWILFSLISLFELAFVKLIEWVPLWSYIKLGAICWLVLPRFKGAHCCYISFIHCCLSVNLEEVQRRLNKRLESSLEEKSFLSLAERYAAQNGTGALMKLITSKGSMTQFGVEEMKVGAEAERQEMPSAVMSNLNEFNTSQKDTNRGELPEKNAFAAKLVKSADAYLVQTEKTTIAAVKVKEATVPAAVAEKELREHLRKVQKEWTCAVCQVKTCSEADLNSHLGGRKHKNKCEELKLKVRATKQTAKYKAVSSSPASKETQTNQDSKKPVSGDGLSEDKFRKQAEKLQVNVKSELCKQNTSAGCNSGSVGLKRWCPYCEITCYREKGFLSHLNGKKHLAKVQEMAGHTAGMQGWDYTGYTAGAQGWDYSGLAYGWS